MSTWDREVLFSEDLSVLRTVIDVLTEFVQKCNIKEKNDKGSGTVKKTILLLLMLVFLSACGREESSQIEIRNYTLPDKDKFEESYTADKKEAAPSSQEIHQTYRWNPHGVFTYVMSGGYSWSTALFKISSVDYDKHCAVVTYTVKDDNGYQLAKIEGKKPKEEDYFFESGGERVVGLDETEDEDGTRHIILYLSNEHYLEFIGKEKLETSKYCYLGMSYKLKREG